MDCIFEDNTGNCLRTRLARDLDQIEREVTGQNSEPPLSVALEQAGNIVAEVVDDLQKTDAEEIIEKDGAQNDEIGKNRKTLRLSMRPYYLSFFRHFFFFSLLLLNIP